jgi:hypothetical protein
MLTFRTVRVYFFRNVHVIHYQLPNKETHLFLYFITYKPKKEDIDMCELKNKQDKTTQNFKRKSEMIALKA